MTYCHTNTVIHRDLKPNNILFSEDLNEVRIADFGLARTYSLPLKAYTHEVVTLWYRAPEVLLGAKEYSLGVDSWSIGCIFFELMTGQIFLPGDSEIDQIFKIFKLLGTPDEENWPGVTEYEFWKATFPKFKQGDFEKHCKAFKDPLALDLMRQLVHLIPAKRITCIEALRHPYFDDLDKSKFYSYDYRSEAMEDE